MSKSLWATSHAFSQVEIKDRKSVQDLLKTLLDPLVQKHSSPGGARIKVPGGTAVRFDETAAQIEGWTLITKINPVGDHIDETAGYARPLWGLASLLAGGGVYDGTERFIEGLRNGTDPMNEEEYWGQSIDNDQRMVEMCCIGYTLAVAPIFWSSLDAIDRTNVETYLGGINDKVMPDTNWLWFRVFANLGLKKCGAKFSPERLESDIKRLDVFYRGDGWSNDGPEGIHQMDYYSGSYAIQFLQLLYAKLAGDDEYERERIQEFKKRAQVFALDFIHYSDPSGHLITYGRSLGYRFGMIAFWSALAFADVDLPSPLTWGIVKGLILRHLRWWQKYPEIFGPSGCLTIGYTYPNMHMIENYGSPGSPYWACLTFVCLAVPEDHPLWASEEEPYPSDILPKIKALKHPGHIIIREGGHSFLLSSGQACGYIMKASAAKYGKFAYSSTFGYSVPSGSLGLDQHALDSTLGLSDDGGEVWKTRRLCEVAKLEYYNDKPVLFSIWRPFDNVEIKTWLIPPTPETPNWHLRIHKISTERAVRTADGSFATRNVSRKTGRALGLYSAETGEGTSPKIIGNYDKQSEEGFAKGKNGAFAVSSQGAVGIVARENGLAGRTAMIVNADPNTNLMESRTVIPSLIGELKSGERRWYLTAVFAKPGQDAPLEGWESKPKLPAWLVTLIGSGS